MRKNEQTAQSSGKAASEACQVPRGAARSVSHVSLNGIVSCLIFTLTLLFLMLLSPGESGALPDGGTVVSGGGNIGCSGTEMQIHQSTDKLIINWHGFGIGPGEKVTFIQPGASALALNRVIGSCPSALYGQLSANGRIFLVNPNGILFGPGSRVNVGGIVASTLSISDNDFLSGNYTFSRGEASGTIVNQGDLIASDNGYVALLGSQVMNKGLIFARMGTAALASGDRVTLDMDGDSLVFLSVDQAALQAGVENRGLIQAEGGTVIMSARAAEALLGTVVNNEGIVEAKGIEEHNGVIRLDGGTGTVLSSGVLDASGRDAGETGGTVVMLGGNVGLTGSAKLDVSGTEGGGTALIGGDWQGTGLEGNAKCTFVGSMASIFADALSSGNGGKVVVWSDEATRFYGTISARGGILAGDGGSVETSSRGFLGAFGTVSADAFHGRSGIWLLDPNDIIIQAAGPDTNTTGGPDFTTIDDSAILTTGSIENALNSGTNVVVTTGSAGTNLQSGDITVADSITKSDGLDASLFLKAARHIIVNPGVQITSASSTLNVTLNSDIDSSGGGGIYLGSGSLINSNGGNIILGGGTDAAGFALGTGSADAGGDWFTNGFTNHAFGIGLDNAQLLSGGGNVTLRGMGSASSLSAADGVVIGRGSIIETTGGAISISGYSGGSGATAGNTATGVFIGKDSTGAGGGVVRTLSGNIDITGIGGPSGTDDRPTCITIGTDGLVESTTGDVTLTGYAQDGSARGIFISSSGMIRSNGSSSITLDGRGSGIESWLNGITLDGGSILGGTGDVALIAEASGEAEAIKLLSGTLSGSGNLLIMPKTASDPMGIGDSTSMGTGNFRLDTATINAMSDGFSSITIGHQSGTGAVDISSVTFKDPVVIRAPGTGGSITVNGALSSGSNALSLISGSQVEEGTAGSISATSLSVTAAGNVNMDNANAVDTVAINAGNNAVSLNNGSHDLIIGTVNGVNGLNSGTANTRITTAGSVTQTRAITASGLELLGNGGTYSLTHEGNAVSILSGNTGTVTYSQPVSLAIGTLGVEGLTVSNTTLVRTTGATADLTLHDGVSAGGTGDCLVLAAGRNFFNNAGSSALALPEGGRFLVYSSTPASDTRGGLTYAFKQYGTAYGGSILGSGNGFIYSTAPSLTVGLTGTTSKVYDGLTTATLTGTNYSIAGVLDGDTVTVSSTGATYNNESAGTGKTVTATGIAISSTTNGQAAVYGYSLGSTTASGAIGTITKRGLFCSGITANNKVYDGNTSAVMNTSGASLSGVLDGDTVALSTGSATGAFANKNVGTGKTVTVSGLALSGADMGNYSVGSTTATADITPKTLTITLSSSVSKIYDSTTSATLFSSNYSMSGKVSGDTVTLNNPTSGEYDSKNVGTSKTVTVNGMAISGADAGNYQLSSTSASGTVGSITKAPLTITATTNTKAYDGTTSASAIPTVSGLKGSDTVTGLKEVYADENAGTGKTVLVDDYVINDGYYGYNYNVTTVNDTTGVIEKVPLVITADNKIKAFGEPNPTFTATYIELVPGDGPSDITGLTLNTSATQESPMGSYDIVPSGGESGNYSISFANGGLIVTEDAATRAAAIPYQELRSDRFLNVPVQEGISSSISGEAIMPWENDIPVSFLNPPVRSSSPWTLLRRNAFNPQIGLPSREHGNSTGPRYRIINNNIEKVP